MMARLKSWLVHLALRLVARLARDDANKAAAIHILEAERSAAMQAPTSVHEAANKLGRDEF